MKDPILQLLELRRRLISDRPWAALAFTTGGVMLLVTMDDPIAVVVAVLLLLAAAAVLTWHLLDKKGWIAAAQDAGVVQSVPLRIIVMVRRLGARGGMWWTAVALILVGIVLTGGMLATVIADNTDQTTLRREGLTVTAKVVSVEDTNRSGESLVVAVQLPDGARTDVDLSESDQVGVKVGETLQIVVDPDQPDINSPVDALQEAPDLAVAVLQQCAPFALIGVLGIGILLSRRRTRQSQS